MVIVGHKYQMYISADKQMSTIFQSMDSNEMWKHM